MVNYTIINDPKIIRSLIDLTGRRFTHMTLKGRNISLNRVQTRKKWAGITRALANETPRFPPAWAEKRHGTPRGRGLLSGRRGFNRKCVWTGSPCHLALSRLRCGEKDSSGGAVRGAEVRW